MGGSRVPDPARRRHVDVAAEVGVRGPIVVGIGGGDGENAGIGRRVVGPITRLRLVAGRGHHQEAVLLRVVRRRLLVGVAARAAVAGIDDLGAVVGRPAHTEGAVAREHAVRVADLHRHHRRLVTERGDVGGVVRGGTDDAGRQRPVADRVRVGRRRQRDRRVHGEVLAGDELAGKVGVRPVGSGIKVGNDNGGRPSGDVPRLLGLHCVQRPLLAEVGVVRRGLEAAREVSAHSRRYPRAGEDGPSPSGVAGEVDDARMGAGRRHARLAGSLQGGGRRLRVVDDRVRLRRKGCVDAHRAT